MHGLGQGALAGEVAVWPIANLIHASDEIGGQKLAAAIAQQVPGGVTDTGIVEVIGSEDKIIAVRAFFGNEPEIAHMAVARHSGQRHRLGQCAGYFQHTAGKVGVEHLGRTAQEAKRILGHASVFADRRLLARGRPVDSKQFGEDLGFAVIHG